MSGIVRTLITWLASTSLSAGATSTTSNTDILGNDSSQGYILVAVHGQCSNTNGTLDITVLYNDSSTQALPDQAPITISIPMATSLQHVFVVAITAARYMGLVIKANSTGNVTNLSATAQIFNQS